MNYEEMWKELKTLMKITNNELIQTMEYMEEWNGKSK